MPNDIEQLIQDFLRYLNVLVLPLPEILFNKIIPSCQENKLRKITLKPNSGKSLSIEIKNRSVITLSKNDLEGYAISVEDFRKGIEDIKSKDPKKKFQQLQKRLLLFIIKNYAKFMFP